jgi:hypothetical protein
MMRKTRRPLNTSLVGCWVSICQGDYGRCGQIVMTVGADHYLVRIRPPHGLPQHSQLMTNQDLCSDSDRDYYVAIFDTEADYDAWQTFMDTPDDDGGPRIVPMRKPE